MRTGGVLFGLDGLGLGEPPQELRVSLNVRGLGLRRLRVKQALTEGGQLVQPVDQVDLQVGHDGLGGTGVALDRLDGRRQPRPDRLPQRHKHLAYRRRTQCQCFEGQHHSVEHRAQGAALLGRLHHARGHVVQRGQQQADDLIAQAVGGQLDLVQRIIEVSRLGGRLAAHFYAQGHHLGRELIDAIAPLIQKRNQIRPGLAEDLHGQSGFFCAIGQGFEAIGQIEQDLIGGPQRAVLALELDPQSREVECGLLRPGGRLQHRGGELTQPLLKAFGRDPGLLGRGLPDRQGLHTHAHPLRHLIQRVARVHGRLEQSAQPRQRDRRPEVGQDPIDATSHIDQAA